MPAPISIIVPTLNAQDTLPGLLADLVAGLDTGLIRELIVADGGSQDDTPAIAEEVGARFVSAPKGRGTQLAAGADQATGDWFLVLHADSRLSENWPLAVADHISTCREAAHFRLAFDSRHPMARITAGWANLRARRLGLPYGDQGLLLPSGLYTRVGGYDLIPLMEDVAMARKLRGSVQLPATITTSPTRYAARGWLRQGSANLVTLTRYLLGADPAKLADSYRKSGG